MQKQQRQQGRKVYITAFNYSLKRTLVRAYIASDTPLQTDSVRSLVVLLHIVQLETLQLMSYHGLVP